MVHSVLVLLQLGDFVDVAVFLCLFYGQFAEVTSHCVVG